MILLARHINGMSRDGTAKHKFFAFRDGQEGCVSSMGGRGRASPMRKMAELEMLVLREGAGSGNLGPFMQGAFQSLHSIAPISVGVLGHKYGSILITTDRKDSWEWGSEGAFVSSAQTRRPYEKDHLRGHLVAQFCMKAGEQIPQDARSILLMEAEMLLRSPSLVDNPEIVNIQMAALSLISSISESILTSIARAIAKKSVRSIMPPAP